MEIGTISFQANDKMDVFHVEQVVEQGIEQTDETLFGVEDPQFDGDKAWVSGNVPRVKPVNIDGDTAVIIAWFKAKTFDKPYTVRVYIECELAEELQTVLSQEKESDRRSDSILEPQEINL